MKTPISPLFPSKSAKARIKDALPIPTTCNLCGGHVDMVCNSKIYGKMYGKWPWAYKCRSCFAYVGIHEYTDIPMGTLANHEMREARKHAKAVFNPLWQSGDMTRSQAYEWLAEQMQIPKSQCHIAMFDVQQCNAAIQCILNIKEKTYTIQDLREKFSRK